MLLFTDSLLESSVGSSRSEYEVSYSLDELDKVKDEIELVVSGVKGRRQILAGSDDELMEVVSRLCGGSSSLETTAICGIGGPLLAENILWCA